MRKFAILTMAALLALSLTSIVAPAGATPAKTRTSLPGLVAVEPDALSEALDEGRLTQAEYALERARSVFELGEVRDEFGAVQRPEPRSVTWILRDLALRTYSLDGAEREAAKDILARPDGGIDSDGIGWNTSATKASPECGVHVCVHYVTDTSDQATTAWAKTTLATFEDVWATEVGVLGFRAPKADGTKGGDARLDVYIDDLDVDSLYGYCSVAPFSPPPWDQPAYCSVDNDYARFVGPNTAVEILQATAAHEFFHAVQFAYDAGEDAWVGEATATWMEDQVYDSVNDNRGYAANSISQPQISADSWGGTNGAPQMFPYGQWVWMEYLAQVHGADLIRRLWERLDAISGAPDDYSVEGLANVLGGSAAFSASFADFAAVNVDARSFYAEGSEAPYFYAPSPRQARHTLGPDVTGSFAGVDHLSSRLVSFTPPDAAAGQFTVAVNMSDTTRGSRATLVSLPSGGGAPAIRTIDLDASGYGQATATFSGMSEVVLVLTNSSTRYSSCTKLAQTTRTCNGSPADEDQAYSYSAAVGTTAIDPGQPTGETPVGPRVENFKAAPEVITPNGDGRKDKTKIVFDLLDDANVTLSLVRNGSLVGYFARDEALAGGYRYPIVWDGRNAGGRLVKSGTYTVKLKAVGPTGTTSRKISVTVRR